MPDKPIIADPEMLSRIEVAISIPSPEPNPKTEPSRWLLWTINEALLKLLSDPRPLVYGEDGELHYVDCSPEDKP